MKTSSLKNNKLESIVSDSVKHSIWSSLRDICVIKSIHFCVSNSIWDFVTIPISESIKDSIKRNAFTKVKNTIHSLNENKRF
jgi:hypothetical protein